MIFLVLLSIFLHRASSSPVEEPVCFSFSAFNSQSCSHSDLICSGAVIPYEGYLSLTSEPIPSNSSSRPTFPLHKVGRVLYSQPVVAWPAMISTTFTIKISAYPQSTAGAADGLTFIFAPDNKPSPNESYGEYLGLFNSSSIGVNVSLLAVELDTYKNSFDPDGNHIGIDTTSVISVATRTLSSAGINLKSGRPIKVQIYYDGWTNMLYVSMAYSGNPLQKIIEKHLSCLKQFQAQSMLASQQLQGIYQKAISCLIGPSQHSHCLLLLPRTDTWLSHISRTSLGSHVT